MSESLTYLRPSHHPYLEIWGTSQTPHLENLSAPPKTYVPNLEDAPSKAQFPKTLHSPTLALEAPPQLHPKPCHLFRRSQARPGVLSSELRGDLKDLGFGD